VKYSKNGAMSANDIASYKCLWIRMTIFTVGACMDACVIGRPNIKIAASVDSKPKILLKV